VDRLHNKLMNKLFIRKRIRTLAIAILLLFQFYVAQAQTTDSTAKTEPTQSGSYTPNGGFKIVKAEQGELNFRLYSYIRYLNQLGMDTTYTDAFGKTKTIDTRQDVQLNKVSLYFFGWLLDPKFRYMFYVWTNNTAQGQGAQVVVGGTLSYIFSNHLTLGAGIYSLPGVRTTEGNFPFWLTTDNRSISDEFFRPSYTMGIWATGDIVNGLKYNVMLGNNMSQLGVDAGELDNSFSTFSAALVWFPTTGEFGKRAQFGDFNSHEEVATRLGAHFTRSPEDRQGVPSSEAFENVTIRLSDGSVIFAPHLFGDGIQLDKATYHMSSFDAGIKYKGFSLEGEYYIRWVNSFAGRGTENLTFDELKDHGYQLMASSMIIPKFLQLYAITGKIFGEYGDPWEVRGGLNLFPWENQVVRCNLEYIHTYRVPSVVSHCHIKLVVPVISYILISRSIYNPLGK